MTGRRKFSELRDGMEPEIRDRAEAKAAALSHDFRETIVRRAQRDPAFRAALIEEARHAAREGDHETEADVISLVAQSMGLE